MCDFQIKWVYLLSANYAVFQAQGANTCVLSALNQISAPWLSDLDSVPICLLTTPLLRISALTGRFLIIRFLIIRFLTTGLVRGTRLLVRSSPDLTLESINDK
jgi:hypothetical protein